ncbi:MAG: hypothetical protein ACTHMS_17680 [Jatrophihabitans sp.]|uniref:hypothetical protein n=1 Tax=Jatrophihabitans sp. TaxID=1932789 RepID=UPI003F7FF696
MTSSVPRRGRPRPRHGLQLAAAGALALVAACSSSTSGTGSGAGAPSSPPASSAASGPSSSTPVSTPPSSAPGAPSSAPSSSAPAADLQGLVLQASDLPSGWKGTPRTDNQAQDQAEQRKLVACVGTGADTSADRVGRADSEEFESGQSQLSSDVTAWRTQDAVDANVALLNQPRTNSCYQQQIRDALAAQLPAGTTLDRVDVKLTPAGAGSGNVVATADGTIVATAGSQHITIRLGAAFITGKQLTGTVQWVGIGAPVPAAVVQAAVTAVAKRIADA